MTPEPGSESAREHVLRTAWELIERRQDTAFTLVELARVSGVSRQTLYVNFGSRAGLFSAMVDYHDALAAGPPALKRARAVEAPERALEAYVTAWFDYVSEIFPVASVLASASLTDEDARAAWGSRMQLIHGGLLELTKRLARDGRLQPDWTAATAADWCFNAIHIDTWRHLVVERGWKPRTLARRVCASLRVTLVR